MRPLGLAAVLGHPRGARARGVARPLLGVEGEAQGLPVVALADGLVRALQRAAGGLELVRAQDSAPAARAVVDGALGLIELLGRRFGAGG